MIGKLPWPRRKGHRNDEIFYVSTNDLNKRIEVHDFSFASLIRQYRSLHTHTHAS